MTDDTLNQMYATYRDMCKKFGRPVASFDNWYHDYYYTDVWVSGSHAAKDHDDVADKKPVKMPYDKHDAVLVAKTFQLTH